MDDSLDRMKNLMDYGKLDENKQYNDKSLEHSTEGADGKIYGIIREGSNYFIEVAKKPSNGKRIVSEDFEFIGGWMNRKNNQYSSYSNTLKNFDQKMMSLAEAYNKVGEVVTESIDPSKKEDVLIKETEGMRYELNRLQSIMKNAQLISEGKCLSETKNEFCPVVGGKAECGCNTTKAAKNGKQKAISAEGGETAKEASKAKKDKLGEGKYVNVKGKWYNKKGHMVNESEVLAWNENEGYLDTEHGTEVGDGAPFTKKTDAANKGGVTQGSKEIDSSDKDEAPEGVVVKEGMEEPTKFDGYHQIDKGLPTKGGMGKIGDGAPYDEPIKEEDDMMDECDTNVNEDFDIDDIIDDENPDTDAEETPDNDSIATELDAVDNGGDDSIEISGEEDGEENEMSLLRDIISRLSKLEEKLPNEDDADFEDDSLYDNEENGEDDGEGTSDEDAFPEVEDGPEGEDAEFGDDGEEKHDDKMSESRVSKKRSRGINEDKLNYFGKHPAYQKKVMSLPNTKHTEKEGYNDWNDESVKGEAPYGQKIGSSAPFTINPKVLDRAIAESIKKVMFNYKKKH